MGKRMSIPILAYICENNIRKCVMIKEDTPIYLEDIYLENFRCFKGKYRFPFIKRNINGNELCQWTVLLGNNGSGKTNLLKMISNFQPIRVGFEYEKDLNVHYAPYIYPYSKFSGDSNFGVSANFCFPLQSFKLIKDLKVETLCVDNTPAPEGYIKLRKASSMSYFKNNKNYCDDHHLTKLHIYAYGVNRCNVLKNDKQTRMESNADSLYGDVSSLIRLEDWILQLELAARNNSSQACKWLEILQKKVINILLPGVKGFECKTNKLSNNYIEFKTDNGTCRYEDLGYGYQVSLSWIFDFCRKMFERYPDSENPLKEAAVVLVDELDLHLHPKWQRTIIHDLSTIFPKTQFIVSTHSPLIIQSIENINLFVLHNHPNGTQVEHFPDTSFQGWTVEEIMCELMDLGENIRPERYRELKVDFEKAMNSGDFEKGKKAYDELKKILHPQNVENDLLDIDLGQLKALQDD